ncbi:hypothetical protein Clacol_005329 [Clathrus columnatus]|uniref:Uncharacterized protein n=1 Tax=Clathrus columnatus TaxID=1419009 RepID=A0AAV5AEK3_9AGAM|nr:hypothetical protein Clacol_005329 [Clathrus columnatus]
MSQPPPLSSISQNIQGRRLSTRRRGSISAGDPWGIQPETDRGVASVLHIVKAPSPLPPPEQDEKARRRRSLHNHPKTSSSSGGVAQGRNSSPGASSGRISFAASGFGFTPLSGGQKDDHNQATLQRRSSIASHSAPHTILTPLQVCEIAQQCARPSISRPSTPGNNGHTSAVSPVKFTPLPETSFLPFLDRPAEVQELLTSSPTRKLFLLLEQIFPAGGSAGKEDDPASWNYAQLQKWLTKTTREEADDIVWIQKAKTCISARSEVIWERIKAAFGVPPELDGVHYDIEGPESMDGEDTSAVDDEYDDTIWVEEIVASSQPSRSPILSPTSSYFGRESPSLTRQGASRMEDISEDVSDGEGAPKRPVTPLVHGLRIVNQPSPPPSRRYSSPTPSIHSASSSQSHLPYHTLSDRAPGNPLFPSSFARVALGPTLKANNPSLRSPAHPPQSAFPSHGALFRNRHWAESWDARRHGSAVSTTSGSSSTAIPPPPTSRNNSSQGTGSSRVVSVTSSKGKAVERNNINDNNNLNPSSNHGSHLKHNNNRAGPSRSTASDTISKAPVVGPRGLEDIKFEDGTPPPINAPSAEPPPSGKGASQKTKPKPKSKKGPKTKKRHTEKSNKGISIFDILARLFLLWFTIYTVSVCPEDIQMRSPICRALTEYRRLILEPYILPPLHAALQNPVIASAVRRVEPVYTTAVKVTTPVVRRTRQEWRLRVMPQLVWLRIRARPYVRQLQRKYDAVLGPYVNDVMLQYRFHVEPRVEKAYGTAEQKWLAARPYVRPIWKAAKRLPGAILHVLIRLIVNAKTKWVDPQVTKIWASIVEQERASREGIPVVESVDVADITEAITSVGVTPVFIPTTSSDRAESETATEESPLVPIPATFDVTDEIAASIISETLSPPLASSTGHIVEPTDCDHPDIDFPAITDDAAASAASILQETLSPSVMEEGNAVNSVFVAAAIPAVESDEDLDTILDEFLAEILTDETETESSSEPEPTVHEETPEEMEERLRLARLETARKRADLESRHSNWEEEIEKLGKTQRKDVKNTLTRLRSGVVSDAKDPAGFVRKQVVDIVNEAEKSLKGLKAFSKKLLAQDEKDNIERMEEWNDVVAKVDKKFGVKVDNAAQTIREWIGEHVQTELQEIGVFAEKITNLAAQAQQDLGMGYTWLADVTYNDWQRYHKLVKTVSVAADSFVDNYRGLQNGTQSDAPGDPLVEVMERLQEEVDDIIMGFEASIGQIRSTVLDKLYLVNKEEQDEGTSVDSDPADAESTSIETTLVLSSADKDEPQVSILPIDVEEDSSDRKIPPGIFMSRSPEEVQQAMSRAEAARAHEEL